MKKFLLFLLILFSCNSVFAEDWNSTTALNRVNTIGNKLLKANGVQHTIQFKVSDEEDVNAYANLNKEVYVFKGLLQAVSNDEELAFVISHEIGHILNGHCAKQGVLNTGIGIISDLVVAKYDSSIATDLTETLVTSKISRNDEFEADLTGADLMIKAGYNPLAGISSLNKISGNYFDVMVSHPSTDKRLLNLYEYVEYNHPEKIKTGFNTISYNDAMKVIEPKVEKRKNSTFKTKRYEKKQEKLLAKKQKRMKKMSQKSTIWDGYYSTLLMFAQ